MFSISLTSNAEEFLFKSNKELARRITEKIELLKVDPVPHNSVKIVGEQRTFRIRIGDYRVLYEVNWNEKIILVYNIDKRAKVYS